MPAYHSTIDTNGLRVIAKIPIAPLRTTAKGPAPSSNDPDFLDEAFKFFKANIFFRNFDVQGDGDRLLIYCILTISDALNKVVKKNKQEAIQTLNGWALQNIALPGDSNFSLGGYVGTPANKADADNLRGFFAQFRQELANRLIERLYKNDPNTPDKWWMCFCKRKFLGKEL